MTAKIWSNWSGSVTAAPQRIALPESEEELCALVCTAGEGNRTIRVAGSGHSFVPLSASDNLIVSLDGLQGIVHIDDELGQATIRAGSKLHQIGEPLWEAGLAMANMGDIDRQSLAGAISTGTHGTGPALGSISTQIAGLRLITAAGETLDISGKDGELLQAASVALGALGIISRVTLQLLPAYRLHQQTWVEPFDHCLAQLDVHIAATRHFEFFWSPRDDACACKALQPVSATAPGVIDDMARRSDPSAQAGGRLQRYVGNDRIDASYRVFPSERNQRFNEMEYALPAAAGASCVDELRQLMQRKFPEIVWPIEYRTLAADDLWLSPAYQRPTVTISIHQAADLPYSQFFADAETIFRAHDGRPHWGKMHTQTAATLGALYPRWHDFQALRRRIDPDARFQNRYLSQLFS